MRNLRKKKKENNKMKYKTRPEVKKKVSDSKKKKTQKLELYDSVLENFMMKKKQGPSYTCACCQRLLFQNQVQRIQSKHFENKSDSIRLIAEKCISDKYMHQCNKTCDKDCPNSSLWLCRTCYRKISNGQLPAESAINNLELTDIPEVLKKLNNLEKHLVCLHIPFMKIASLPKGGQNAIYGPVVCVPSDIKAVEKLPRNEEDDMILKVKLKRKLLYKGHYEYQFVNSSHIKKALDYLKENNEWYENTTILHSETISDSKNEEKLEFNECENEGKHEDLNEDTTVSGVQYDTCLQPTDIGQEVLDHYFDDIYNIAPAEGKNPVKMLQEKGNEAKSFPHLFPDGKNTWTEERGLIITLSRYFNNRLMHADKRFAQDIDYIFFSQYLSELKQVIDKTQISLRNSFEKTKDGTQITSNMLQDPESLKKLLKSDDALRFLQPIRGTPSFWQNVQKDLFAMLRQLGIPTWFCSFSSAEFRW